MNLEGTARLLEQKGAQPMMVTSFKEMIAGELVTTKDEYHLADLQDSSQTELVIAMGMYVDWRKGAPRFRYALLSEGGMENLESDIKDLVYRLHGRINGRLPEGFTMDEDDMNVLRKGPQTAAFFLMFSDPEGRSTLLLRHPALSVHAALYLYMLQLRRWEKEGSKSNPPAGT